jgi:hypothetical protein
MISQETRIVVLKKNAAGSSQISTYGIILRTHKTNKGGKKD